MSLNHALVESSFEVLVLDFFFKSNVVLDIYKLKKIKENSIVLLNFFDTI